jgi:hypothetical protein
MSRSIPGELDALALGEGAVIRGVRVVRRSLFGYQVAAEQTLLDAAEVALRIARIEGSAGGLAKGTEVCFRCAGDGRGRRDRGVCGVCHGRGTVIRGSAA